MNVKKNSSTKGTKEHQGKALNLQLTNLRTRLTLTTLAVLLIGMGLAAGLAWLSVERLYLDTQRENLLAQARLTAAALQGASLPAEDDPYSQALNAMPGIHTRVLAEQDAVVLDFSQASDVWSQRVPRAESGASVSNYSLLLRPEIDSALRGTPAAAVRRVDSAGKQRVLYAAAPVYAADGSISGVVYVATPLPSGGLPAEVILQLAGAILAAVLLAAWAGTRLARRLARPIEAIARAAEAVSAGDLEQQAPVDNRISELRALSQSFNAMTASLRQSEQVRNAFVADVTHELRTPLTVIKGTVETLEDGAVDDPVGRGPLLASMQRETDRLIRLVNDLLVLTRADAGALKLDIQPLDLAALAQARCEALAALAKGRCVKLRVVRNGRLCQALGDPDRLSQVLDNLLDNAIRHAPEGSPVTVVVEKIGNEIQCVVSDCGPGIPEKHLPFIFERFYRVDTARARQSGGAGLGLAIVKALVQAQGGRVAAESAEGQGTTLRVWLQAV